MINCLADIKRDVIANLGGVMGLRLRKLVGDMHFELYARYKVAALFLAEAAKKHGLEKPTVLELGSGGINYLGEFFPEARVTLSNLDLTNVQDSVAQVVEADAADLRAFKDGSFDFVISLAVMEHVPLSQHEIFLAESCRVAGIGAFHAAPFDDDFILQAEQEVNDFYESLYGIRHRWLEEHKVNGHPNMERVGEILNKIGCDYCVFEHMDVEIWKDFYSMLISASFKNRALSQHFYQDNLFFQDIGAQNVFKHIYVSKTEMLASELLKTITREYFTPINEQARVGEISEFKKQYLRVVEEKEQEKLQRNVRKLCILNFIDDLAARQGCVYLYGLTPDLLIWLNTIQSARTYQIRVFDKYETGRLNAHCKRTTERVTIESPSENELSGKTVVVFPETRYEEIVQYLESINADPIFYADIAE